MACPSLYYTVPCQLAQPVGCQ
ncbi:jg25948, partial [Pararge aegeria aegeria]